MSCLTWELEAITPFSWPTVRDEGCEVTGSVGQRCADTPSLFLSAGLAGTVTGGAA